MTTENTREKKNKDLSPSIYPWKNPEMPKLSSNISQTGSQTFITCLKKVIVTWTGNIRLF
jgi:hypothetical protein